MSKLKVKVKAFDHKIVDSAALKIVSLLKEAKASYSGPVPLPTKKEIFTILRSVHVNKTSREQFEQRTHQRLIVINSVNSALMDKIKRLELPTGAQILIETK
ncbi:30S ribosomal protein S10 [Mesomycoplasma lagogenitalium]|uniref:Small ribosomal subunit protein uS10 n=1 Tax=Mesomycoplasma lagogenitalium TaxID=171286 RepID=A0ABY8LTL7_9BACT|nr:30S ribosomal protein S10 [Mesomycoplasma lagogenitalium]WGI36589.1 30S ribosomal protein S10 [Mesomycoplasma lagogenitalium]